jgi:hypothetical protein
VAPLQPPDDQAAAPIDLFVSYMSGKSRKRQAIERAELEARIADGMGRPGAYHPAFNRRATDYCLLGATNEDLAGFFETSLSTIEQWLREIPSFRKAISKGRELALSRVARSLHASAVGYKHKETKHFVVAGELVERTVTKRYPPNVNAAALLLVNRDPKRWKHRKLADAAVTLDLGDLVREALARRDKEAKVIEATATFGDDSGDYAGALAKPSSTSKG